MAEPYAPLSPDSAAKFGDAIDAMAAVENDLFSDPDYILWDGDSDLNVGCRGGGFVSITPGTLQDTIRFADCTFVPGLQVIGSGAHVFASNAVNWSVTMAAGSLDYLSNGEGRHVSGTWRGVPVDLTR